MKSSFFKALHKNTFSTGVRETLPFDSNFTRIRIWKSGYFGKNGTFRHTSIGYALLKGMGSFRRANIGHVSLETKDFYASLWPEQLTIMNKYKVQNSEQTDIEIDHASEGRAPDTLIDLETLNVSSMLEELKKFEKQNKYHLIGQNKVFNANNAASCSSLAYSLLVAGGIRNLVPKTFSIRDQILVTPNNLISLVLKAKEKESSVLNNSDKSDKLPPFNR